MRTPTIPAVGDQAEGRTFGPITRSDIVRYQGASGDFHPLHHDEPFAQACGFPTVFSVGMLQAALLATYATDWFGVEHLRRYTVRFVEQVWPGDRLSCTAVISQVEPGAGVQAVTVDLTMTRQTDGVALQGTAVFELPGSA